MLWAVAGLGLGTIAFGFSSGMVSVSHAVHLRRGGQHQRRGPAHAGAMLTPDDKRGRVSAVNNLSSAHPTNSAASSPHCRANLRTDDRETHVTGAVIRRAGGIGRF